MAAIAVSWGAADREALAATGPDALVDTVADLTAYLLGHDEAEVAAVHRKTYQQNKHVELAALADAVMAYAEERGAHGPAAGPPGDRGRTALAGRGDDHPRRTRRRRGHASVRAGPRPHLPVDRPPALPVLHPVRAE